MSEGRPIAEVVDNAAAIVAVEGRPGREHVILSNDNQVDLRELGSSQPSPWTSWLRQEYNVALQGARGLQKYDQMRKGDGTVRSSLRLAKGPVLAARWFMEPASKSQRDVKIADFVWRCLTEFMSISWPQVLSESLLMLDFGYYMFEKVYEFKTVDSVERVVWKKLAPRHPLDVKEWVFDSAGGPVGAKFYPADSTMESATTEVTIPIDKLLVFTFDKEAGNIEGVSVLRSAYKHWYFKDNLYKIDAIQKERHGIGIPVITLPLNYTSEDKDLAQEMGRNLRTNERAHVVVPPGWTIEFAKLEGQPVSALDSAKHHDVEIVKNVLATFLDQAVTTKEEDHTMFLKAMRFTADIITDTINHYAIPQLVNFNFAPRTAGYPKLRARRIGEQSDWRTMSFAVRNYVGAGIIRPDDELEEFIRREMDLPMPDEDSIRAATTPQNRVAPPTPPRVGNPRQAPPTARPPRSNSGTDRSGGA